MMSDQKVPGLLRHVSPAPRRLWGDRIAAVGIIFGLMLGPLLGCIALSIDFGMKTRAVAAVNAAADSAALVAATTAANAFSAGLSNWQTLAQTAGANFFTAQIGDVGYLTTQDLEIAISQPNSNAGSFVATMNYTGSMPTYFGRALSNTTMSVTGGSTATMSVPSYVDFHFLIDNSGSMLIGATTNDVSNLQAAVGCRLACHTSTALMPMLGSDGAMHMEYADSLGVAKAKGITLRLDVVDSAIAQVLSSIQNQNSTKYRVAVYGFDDPSKNDAFGPVEAPITLYPLGSDFQTAEAKAAALGPAMTPLHNTAVETGSNISMTLNYVSQQIATSSQDGSAKNPKQFLFMLTDGVDDYINSGGSWVVAPINPNECSIIKNRGIQLYILYTPYVPLPGDSTWEGRMVTWAGNGPVSTLLQDMQQCASSPSTFFQASSSSDINTQVQNMLTAAIGAASRFTH